MDEILYLLKQNARLGPSELADRLNLDIKDVEKQISELEKNGTILGYHAVVDPEKARDNWVTAFIEIKLTPEREGGFDRIAERIAKFDQVSSCYLMSGGYDLAAIVEGETLQEVARFVTEKLSTIDRVQSTSTHFQLKIYKQNGFIASDGFEDQRPPVS